MKNLLSKYLWGAYYISLSLGIVAFFVFKFKTSILFSFIGLICQLNIYNLNKPSCMTPQTKENKQ